MKLNPKHVRLVIPFWPALFRRTLRFTGRRNTIHLQETALVAEGELLLFRCLGLERIFGRALSAWSTVTVPYSRILAVRYRTNLVLRLVLIALCIAVLTMATNLPGMSPTAWNWLDFAADLIIVLPVVGVAAVIWWRIPPTYSCTFRSKDGRRTRFHFVIRTKCARQGFDQALRKYREDAQSFLVTSGDR